METRVKSSETGDESQEMGDESQKTEGIQESVDRRWGEGATRGHKTGDMRWETKF